MTRLSESKQALFIAGGVTAFIVVCLVAWWFQQAWLGVLLGLVALFVLTYTIARYFAESNYYRRVLNACLFAVPFFLIPYIPTLWEPFVLFILEQFPELARYVQVWQKAQQANNSWLFPLSLCVVIIWAIKADVALRRQTTDSNDSPPTDTEHTLRNELLQKIRADIEEQLRQVLPTPDRIPVEFSLFKQLNPQRNFRGRLSARNDLNKAFEQSRAVHTDGSKGPERLLVVGDPGAGKTIALLHLASVLAKRAEADPSAPVPILFSLGGWSSAEIMDWMVGTLAASTGLLPGQTELVTTWCQQGMITPLFDGLDELTDDDERRACRDAINRYLTERLDTPVVVTCRINDYTRIHEGVPLADYLSLNVGIQLEPLTQKQIKEYLAALAGRAPSWKDDAEKLTAIINTTPDGSIASILKLPLWLSLLEYSQPIVDKLCTTQTSAEAMNTLLEGYLSKVPTQERRYLASIAGFLTSPAALDQTTFYLDHLTGIRVPILFQVASGLIFGLSFGLIFGLTGWLSVGLIGGLIGGLSVGLIGGLSVWLSGGLSETNAQPVRSVYTSPSFKKTGANLIDKLTSWLIFGLSFGLSFGLIFGLIGWLILGLSFGLSFGVIVGLSVWLSGMLIGGLVESFQESKEIACTSSPDAAIPYSRQSLIFNALIFGLSFGLIFGLSFGLVVGLIVWLTIGLSFILIVGLIESFLESKEIARASSLDAAISYSRQSLILHILIVGLIFGLIFGLSFGLIFGLSFGLISGPSFGLVVGLSFGLDKGGWFLLLQWLARREAVKRGLLPKDMIKFLEFASALRLLRPVGSGFQFRHRELLDYLKQEAPKPGLEAIRAMSN